MNRGEADHGSQGEEIEIKIEKESQEGCGEKEDGCEAVRPKAQVSREEKESSADESSAEEKICTEEIRAEETSASEARRAEAGTRGAGVRSIRASRNAEPGDLSPVQPAGGRRQSG